MPWVFDCIAAKGQYWLNGEPVYMGGYWSVGAARRMGVTPGTFFYATSGRKMLDYQGVEIYMFGDVYDRHGNRLGSTISETVEWMDNSYPYTLPDGH